MKIDKRNPSHWLLLLRQGVFTLLAIALRPLTRRPKNPVVILYGHQLSGNLKALHQQWLVTYGDQLSLHFLCLDADHCDRLEREGVRPLRCGRLRDMLTLTKASAMITDHGLHTMTPLLFLTNIVFIDVWHGIPFKGFTKEDFWLQRHYDQIWVSSPLLKSIYEEKFGFADTKVHNLGYARTDKLFLRRDPDGNFRDHASIPMGHRIVVYAPTWQQDDTGRELFPFGESQDTFTQKLSDVCRKHFATLVIRSHLNASISTRRLDNVRYCSMKDFPDTEVLLLQTDVLICDWSSIAFDYLALDRPTIFLDVEPPFKNGFSLGKEYRFGKVVSDLDSLGETLEKILQCPQSYTSEQGNTHHAIISAVYGQNTDGKVGEKQLQRLMKLIALA